MGSGPASGSEAPGGAGFDEGQDATRRTRLANERTYLAWWRTGLTAFAVALGSGKLAPALVKGPQWPYTTVGAGFALLGLAFIVYALRRHREVEAAISRGEYAKPDVRWLMALTAAGILLGVSLLAIIAVQD